MTTNPANTRQPNGSDNATLPKKTPTAVSKMTPMLTKVASSRLSKTMNCVDLQRGVTTLTELQVPLDMHDLPARGTVNGRAEKYLSPHVSADGYVPGSTCPGVDRVYDRPKDRGDELRIAQRFQDLKGALAELSPRHD